MDSYWHCYHFSILKSCFVRTMKITCMYQKEQLIGVTVSMVRGKTQMKRIEKATNWDLSLFGVVSCFWSSFSSWSFFLSVLVPHQTPGVELADDSALFLVPT
ncbi:hypothetical protein ACSBR1_039913 [Camellia fascicularis]